MSVDIDQVLKEWRKKQPSEGYCTAWAATMEDVPNKRLAECEDYDMNCIKCRYYRKKKYEN